MTTKTLDKCLDEIARLTAKNAATSGHVWAAEFLLHRVGKLLPHLIADSPYNAVARDTIAEEIRELLAEDREHPKLVLPDGAAGSPDPSEGAVGQGRTTLADEVQAGLHEEPSP